MAEHGNVEYATAEGDDYPAHAATYGFFVKLVRYNALAIVIVLILMAYFLV